MPKTKEVYVAGVKVFYGSQTGTAKVKVILFYLDKVNSKCYWSVTLAFVVQYNEKSEEEIRF